MKTLYSSTFLTVILAFLALMGSSGTPVTIIADAPTPAFQTILEPIGPTLPPEEGVPVKIEVYNSFGCTSCDLFGHGTLPQLVAKYSEDPTVDFHLYLVPNEEDEAELYAVRGAHCAAEYGHFWEMTTKLHEAETLSRREVDLLGQELEIPVVPFRNCIDSELHDEKIGQDVAYARERGITFRPTIQVNGTILLGPQPIENIERVVNQYLNQ